MMNIDLVHFSPYASFAGGILIGIAAAMLILFNGRIAGVSGILGQALNGGIVRDNLWRIAFVMGIIANLPGGTAKVGVISFNPSSEWNKTYVNLRRTIGTYGTANNYNIWFRMDLADGLSVGNAWVDNLKLVNN